MIDDEDSDIVYTVEKNGVQSRHFVGLLGVIVLLNFVCHCQQSERVCITAP